MRVIIPGKPIAKKRPRFFSKGKFKGTYNPQRTEEGKFLSLCHEQITWQPVDVAIGVFMIFRLPRPKSHYGTGKNAWRLKDSAPQYHTQRPDIDNLEKFVADCLNGVAWVDDCQLVKCVTQKEWTDGPGETEIEIFEYS